MPARLLSILAAALLALAACEPQGFFPDDDDDIPRDPVGPCAEDEPRGTCPEGETCSAGLCLADIAFCSAENPAGPCADPDARCVGGACINDSTACSPERPTGDCPAGQECTDGVCATDAPCAPDERFGFCDPGLACVDGACIDRDTICSQENPGGVCPSGLSCHVGVCVPRDDVCGCQQNETCVDGVCRAPEELCSVSAPSGLCAGGAVCSAGACVDVGAGCSAQNPTGVCPVGSICRQGACAAVDGGALCDDDNACTVDTFDTARNRCENRPVTDGASCDDGNSCTTDSCEAGQCVGERIAACVEPPTIEPVTSPTNVGQLRIAGTKPAGAAVSINDLTAVAESPDTTFSVNVNLSPGENVYRIKSVDQGASSGVRELRVVYDITPPVTRTTPEGGVFVAGVTATIATDEPATVFFTTDGSEPTESSQRFTSLKQLRVFSTMTLKVRAKDLAGNLEEEVRTIDFDVTARGSAWRERAALEESLARPGVAFSGTSVIVAGGTDGLAAQAGAFAYDVDAEAWRTLPSMTGARAGLMVVDVNGDLYAIGGENAGTPLNRLERLRATDTAWTTLQPMPSTRHAAAAIHHNGELYVFGGLANGGAALTNVEVYSIADNTWRNDVAPMPRARAGFGVGVVDGEVYVVGGEGQGGALVSEVDVYSLLTNTWRQAAPLPTPRSFLAVGALQNLGRVQSGDRLIVAAGGRDAGGQAKATVEEYVVEENAWRTRALLPAARHSFGFAVAQVAGDVDDVDSELWLVGGQAGTTLSPQLLGFQSPVDHVRRLPDLPEARFLHGAAHLGDRVYLFGGRDFAEKTNAWAFDPETGRYDELPALPSVQNAPASAAIGDRVFALGGFDQFGNAVATVRAFDPIERRWIERQPMVSGRGNAVAVVVDDEIYVLGGENGAPLPTVEIYDTKANTWRAGPLLPAPRTGLMAVNYRGRVIVFGGVAQDGTTVTSIVSQTATGWEQLSGSVPVSFGFATVLADDTVTVFPGRVNGTFDDVVPHVYNVEQQVTRSRHRSEEWLGARFDRRPGVTIAGRVFLFGGNASVNVGPGGRAQVEEVEARCFNGRTDRREGNVRSTELGDGGDGCPGGGFQHRSGTGISFVNDRASDTGSLQGAVDACNAHFGGNVCAQACITSCTAVTRGGTCSCSEALIWHFGNSGCFVSNPTPGTVTGANCTTTVIGTWN